MLDRSTGKIFYHSEYGDLDEIPESPPKSAKLIEIPHKNDLGLGAELVGRFVQANIPEDVDVVQDIFSRRGAYARYKDLLDSKGLLQSWYDFESEQKQDALRQWCEENDIDLAE